MLTFAYSKVFHVRSVTQGDVIRAEAKDIPRIFQVNNLFLFTFLRICLHLITLFTDLCNLLTFYIFDYICLHFQILYAGEGESRKPEDNIGDDSISSVVSSSGNVVMNKSVIGSGKIIKNSTLQTSVPSLIIIFRYGHERARVRPDLISHARLLRQLL